MFGKDTVVFHYSISPLSNCEVFAKRSPLLCGFQLGWQWVTPASDVLAHPPESVFNQSGQLLRSALDGLVQTRRLVSDRDGVAAFEVGFHHTALVALAVLMAILVTKVHFHPRDVIAESAQGIFHFSLDLSDQRLASSNGRSVLIWICAAFSRCEF